jgi:hypothetical protein
VRLPGSWDFHAQHPQVINFAFSPAFAAAIQQACRALLLGNSSIDSDEFGLRKMGFDAGSQTRDDTRHYFADEEWLISPATDHPAI